MILRFFGFLIFCWAIGLKSHPDHELALRQQFGHSGMVTFLIKGGLNESMKFLEALQIFRRVKTLVVACSNVISALCCAVHIDRQHKYSVRNI